MALFRKLFYRKPPDGLLEICERVYGEFLCIFSFPYLGVFLKWRLQVFKFHAL